VHTPVRRIADAARAGLERVEHHEKRATTVPDHVAITGVPLLVAALAALAKPVSPAFTLSQLPGPRVPSTPWNVIASEYWLPPHGESGTLVCSA
jgi:hypothetical protein